MRDAEDLVQEAMARTSARWGRLRDYDVPEAWVWRVAMNLAADLRRRSRRRLAAMTRLAAMPATEVVELPTEDLRIVAALSTVMSRLKRARRALAALLSAEELKGATQDARDGCSPPQRAAPPRRRERHRLGHCAGR